MAGRPRKYTDEERKQKLKEKNARYYETHREKWEGYNANHGDSYYLSQIRHMAKHLDSEAQSKVMDALQNLPARKV